MSLVFKLGPSNAHYLTQENNEAIFQIEVLPGRYAPSCEVRGSVPTANVIIMMGDQMMQGRVVFDKIGTQFLAKETDFKG